MEKEAFIYFFLSRAIKLCFLGGGGYYKKNCVFYSS